MIIHTVSDLRAAFRNGPYAWPGGYPLFFVMSDGGVLSFGAAKQKRRYLLEAIRDDDDSGWRPTAVQINYEDPELFCDHTDQRIPSAYAEDDAEC